MATVQPFAGTHYNPDHVKLGGVLAPPYDVISDAKRDELYGRDLRNIVRIDYGATFPDDVEGVDDRYTRAASFLKSWHDLDVLVRDDRMASTSSIIPSSIRTAARAPGEDCSPRSPRRPWESSDLRPHERTLRGPKADRLALMRATRAQTSPVFAMWTDASGIVERLDGVATGHALLGGRIDGEVASEKLLLWRVADPDAGRRDCRCPAQRKALRRRRSSSLRDRGRVRRGAPVRGPGRSARRAVRTLPGVPRGRRRSRASRSCRRIASCGRVTASRSASTTCGRGSTTHSRPCRQPMGVRRSQPRRRCTPPTTRSPWSRTMEPRCSAVPDVSVGRRANASMSRCLKPRCSARPGCRPT